MKLNPAPAINKTAYLGTCTELTLSALKLKIVYVVLSYAASDCAKLKAMP